MKYYFVLFSMILVGCAHDRSPAPSLPEANLPQYCKPNQSCWPSTADWQQLGSLLSGRLEIPQSPMEPCRTDAMSEACVSAMKNSKNPFYLQDQAGGTQSTGWLGAWNSTASAYAIAAESSKDIAAGVNFAREHKLRLVIKGTGHDYLGRSSASDSLLIWTHKMRKVTLHKAFTPQGCQAHGEKNISAVSAAAGAQWLDAYQEVTVKNGRYVQGGGCTSVGVAGGFLQGGGFGSWSKKYGTAAANLLEAEVVTADGRLVIANACQNQDLFWALRGGGGGTYGVVTRVTLRTHALPKYFGWIYGSIQAKTDASFKELLEKFLGFYRQHLNNENWGEQVKVNGNNTLDLKLTFQGMTAKDAEKIWKPFRNWIDSRKTDLTMNAGFIAIPGSKMWNYEYIKKLNPDAVKNDQRAEQAPDRFWWAADGEQVSVYWYAYQSRWIPIDLFEEGKAGAFAISLFEASRYRSLEIHFNKGLSGASKQALQRSQETSMNPTLYKAAALLIVGASAEAYPGVPGHEPNQKQGELLKSRVSAAMKTVREATPGAGTYANEADYFEPNWQQEFWGVNYARLLDIKRKYDPDRMFTCHHCVGSE